MKTALIFLTNAKTYNRRNIYDGNIFSELQETTLSEIKKAIAAADAVDVNRRANSITLFHGDNFTTIRDRWSSKTIDIETVFRTKDEPSTYKDGSPCQTYTPYADNRYRLNWTQKRVNAIYEAAEASPKLLTF